MEPPRNNIPQYSRAGVYDIHEGHDMMGFIASETESNPPVSNQTNWSALQNKPSETNPPSETFCTMFLAFTFGFIAGFLTGPFAFLFLYFEDFCCITVKRRIPFVWGIVVGFVVLASIVMVVLRIWLYD